MEIIMYYTTDYGADPSGRELSTPAFQKAVDECRANGGGTVYVPDGKYTLGTVRLYSDIHVVLAPGATIYGSRNLTEDFYPDECRLTEFYQDNSHSFYHHSLFLAEECENISITGSGRIDMQGQFECEPRENDLKTNRSIRGAKVISFRECENIAISGIGIFNATDVAIFLGGCRTVRISGLYIDTKIDGINPDCCSDVIISDCIIYSGDDAIAVKSSYTLGRVQVCENIAISGCIVSSDCNGIKLGTESNGGFRNISVTGCVIKDVHQAALAVESVDGGVIDGVVMSGITMNNVGCPFIIILNERCRAPQGTEAGEIKNITLSNITASGPFRAWKVNRCDYWGGEEIFPKQYASLITGVRGHMPENITLSNVNITVDGGGTHEMAEREVEENPKGYPAPAIYGESKAYGMYMRYCRNIYMDNVRFAPLHEDERKDILSEHTENVKITGEI